jgi:hypothetical protein
MWARGIKILRLIISSLNVGQLKNDILIDFKANYYFFG